MADVPDGEDLPEDATIIFHVSGGKTRPRPRPDGAPCEEIDADALKCDEDGISVTWVECFEGDSEEQLRLAALATACGIKVRKSGFFARIRVSELLNSLADQGAGIRVIRNRLAENEGHCLITGIDSDSIGLKMVAAEAFTDFVPATAIPGLIVK